VQTTCYENITRCSVKVGSLPLYLQILQSCTRTWSSALAFIYPFSATICIISVKQNQHPTKKQCSVAVTSALPFTNETKHVSQNNKLAFPRD